MEPRLVKTVSKKTVSCENSSFASGSVLICSFWQEIKMKIKDRTVKTAARFRKDSPFLLFTFSIFWRKINDYDKHTASALIYCVMG